MRIAVAVFVKLVSIVTRCRKPNAEISERAFEKAVAQFHAQ
jgi:hypothetical protein